MTYARPDSHNVEITSNYSRRRVEVNAKTGGRTHIVIDNTAGVILDATEAITIARALIKTSGAPATVLDTPLRAWDPDVDAADQSTTEPADPTDDGDLVFPIEMEHRAAAVETARGWYPDADWDVIIDTAHWIVTGERAAR